MGVSEELERLGRLLDEGKLTTEEFEQAKAALLRESSTRSEERAPGWYNDPSGKATHQAYWDGAKWTGATHPAAGTTAPVSPGKSGTPEWAKAVGGLVIVLVVIAYCGGAFGGDSGFDPTSPVVPTACTESVTYAVSGSAQTVSLTLQNSSGNTEQVESVSVPWSEVNTFDCGEFVYLSAQNNGDTGTVFCDIRVDGRVIESANSSGAFVIASCSGSVPG